MTTRTAPNPVPDARARQLAETVAADPGAPIRAGVLAPGGYGKTAVLGELAAIYRDAGVRVGGVSEALDPAADPARIALLVDDAHRLDPAALRHIHGVARTGQARLIVAARPWPNSTALRELAGALDGTAALRPFDREQIAAHLAAVGLADRPGLDEFVLAQTGGVPALVDRLARAIAAAGHDDPLEVPAAAITELGPQLDGLATGVLDFLIAADLSGPAPHVELLGDLLGCDPDGVGEVAGAARATGLIDRSGRPVPVVRLAIRTLVPVDRRTAVRARLAEAQRSRGPAWAERVALAGDLDTALRVADQVLAGPDRAGHGETAREAARVAAAALAHRGQLGSSAELFRWSATGLSNAFAAIGLIGTGAPDAAGALLGGSPPDGPPTLLSGAAELMARGVHASVTGRPASALADLVRASSLLEPAEAAVLLPDSPAALAAVVALHAGELAVAESVLQRAVRSGMGGLPFAVRHRLLYAWVSLIRGDLDATRQRLRDAGAARTAGAPLPPRDWLFAVALEVGLARRASDLEALRRVWARAGDAAIRHPVDLFTLLPLGELAIAAARMGEEDRLAGHLATARMLLDALDDPPLWAAGLAWSRLHAAIVAERPALAQEQAAVLARHAGHGRQHTLLAAAARCWLDVLGGTIDPAAIEPVARDLHAAGLRWDAARLAGQAAIRTPDRRAMVALMDCARSLSGAGPVPAPDEPGPARISERERQVARLVLDGLTYREVGDRLYISAKTVEHHVARMRQRLGAANRRDLLAQLRTMLAEPPSP
ncbi:MAG TPA: LuxR C-terminal-related transcriptional regulator [Actinophytocola sp.]|uniref:helix-turn-helix transcriptional regulator n=1 Tax=Actinophytocola sp. TaxID=1872138 RepID=UPI002DB687E5|nr:LuxR C-terminal-related transcriptional regulator [Actinophytocola sp.]HEU5470607.1 LuxR C-terminal-related transcriptional regulator [Actinophytocola sp.]